LIQDLYRGRNAADITSLCVYREGNKHMLSCTSASSNKTAHLFKTPALGAEKQDELEGNPKSLTGYETSYSKFYPPSEDKSTFQLAVVISDDQVAMITSAGDYYRATIEKDTAILEKDSVKNFLA